MVWSAFTLRVFAALFLGAPIGAERHLRQRISEHLPCLGRALHERRLVTSLFSHSEGSL